MPAWAIALVVALYASQADVVDPLLRSAVERFYATQEAEDVAGYLSLWSSTAERPRPEQLKFIFDAGDDKFSQLSIASVHTRGPLTIVRVSVTRDRTSANRRPDGSPFVFHTSWVAALTYVREGSDWKLVREGTPADALADALIAASDSAERDRLLAEEPDLVGPSLVSAVSRQASSAAQRAAYPRAQALFERALDLAIRIGDKQLQADMLQNIGNALYYQRNFAAARPVYEQFVAIERELGNDEGIALALVGLGTAQYSQFEYTDAFATFREALAIQERLNDTAALATTLINTGNIQFVEGDFSGAIADYRRARELYRSGADTRGEASALDGLGRSLAAQGDFAAALDAFNGVLEEGRRSNNAGLRGGALFSIADVHMRLGNLDVARGLFEQSRTEFDRLGDQPNVGHAFQAMGKTDLLAGRFATAEDLFTRSAAACTKGNDPECVAHATVGTAFAQSLQQHHVLAVTTYRRAIALFTTLKKREDAARAEIGLSQALTGSGEYAGALAAARHAQREGTAVGVDDVVWRALVASARAQRRSMNATAALVDAKEAVSRVDTLAERAIDGLNDQPSADSTGAYALLAVLQAEANDAAGAFATLERRRAHALRLELARNERDIARGMTQAERDRERQSAAEVATVRAQMDHERALPKPDAARIERLQQRLSAAVQQRSTERAAIFARVPELPVWRGLQPAIMLTDTVGHLSDGELLAEFAIDDDDLIVVIVSRRGDEPLCRAYVSPVPRQTLAERIAQAVDPAVLRDLTRWKSAATDFVNSMSTSAFAVLAAATRLVLVPDDVLWRVPFEALPVDDGFLGDRTTIVYAGSATSLYTLPFVPPASATQPVLAVAAPDVPAPTRDRLQAIAPGWTVRSPDSTDTEVRSIASVFDNPPAAILAGGAATESAVRAQAAAASIVHIAAPFRMNGASPLFSAILLSAEGGPGKEPAATDSDGILEIRELMNLEMHGRLAVLSDGSSAGMRGAASAAEIVRWAWRAAGIPAIVLPRWATDGNASAALMKIVYSRLKEGDSPETALQTAGRELRATDETRAPYFWAGWQVVGR